MPHLKAYDKKGNILAVGYNKDTEQGSVVIPNLTPYTKYPQGEFYVSWEDDNYESEKTVVPEFTTLDTNYKEIVFYAKDILTIKPKTPYDIAVDNGFKGTQEEWLKSLRGEQGQPGKDFTFEDFTKEQLDSLRVFITPPSSNSDSTIKDKTMEDSLVIYPPNNEDIRTYPKTVDTTYFSNITIRNSTPENTMNTDGSFTLNTGGWLFYTVKTVDKLTPSNTFSAKIVTDGVPDPNATFEYAIQDASGNYIQTITKLNKVDDTTFAIDSLPIPENSSTISLRIDTRQATNPVNVKQFLLFDGGLTKKVQLVNTEEFIKGLSDEVDNIKIDREKEKTYHIPVHTPKDYLVKDHPLVNNIFTNGLGKFSTSLDMEDFKIRGGKEYYIDGKRGNDNNDGLSKLSPFKTFKKAQGVIDTGDTLYVSDGDYFRVGGTFFTQISNKSMNIIGLGNNVNLFMADEPTWVKTPNKNNIYEFTRSAVKRVVDFNTNTEFTNVTSLDEVDNTLFSWYSDGTKVYINNGNKEPDKKVIPLLSNQHLLVTNVPTNFYIENLNLYGGARPTRFELSQDNKVYINNCTLNYACQVNGNGLEIVGGNEVIVSNSTASNNYMDGFNYHVGTDGSKPLVIEINCTALENGFEKGTAGSKSNNGTTIHDGLKAIRVNGTYARNDGGNVADVNEGTQSWNLGCTAFESYQGKDYQTSSGSYMWLDSCIGYGSTNSINSPDTNSKVYTRLGTYQNKLILGEEIKY